MDLASLDDPHLRALVKALHEARFCTEENDPVVWTSPLVVDLHVWALAEQRRRDEATRDTRWATWLEWTGREESQTVVRRLRGNPSLLALVTDDPEVLRSMLRPFDVTDDDLQTMIQAASLTA